MTKGRAAAAAMLLAAAVAPVVDATQAPAGRVLGVTSVADDSSTTQFPTTR